MPFRPLLLSLFLLPSLAFAATSSPGKGGVIDWHEFGPDAFEEARRDNKLVLLDLVAVWCHWCHVMEAETYTDPEVARFIEANYVPVKADHDARPDLAERYRDWGWPATVVLDANGRDIVKRAGYIERDNLVRLLAAVVRDPSPEADRKTVVPDAISEDPRLSADVRGKLLERHQSAHDASEGGLAMMMKFLDRDTVLWSLRQIRGGDSTEEGRLRQTLDANLALIDPAFGGVYQYSTHGDWSHPHYEKIMHSQWTNLLAYSQACSILDEPRYCDAGRRIAAYLIEFLSGPDGAFYSSQDADLKQGTKAHDYFALGREARLEQGLPRIDKSRYSSVNGMAIEGLVALHQATGEEAYLRRAVQAAEWVIDNRSLWGGGFRHDKLDASGPYLADTLFMGRAFLSLYQARGDENWLQRSLKAAAFIDKQLRHPVGGLAASVADGTPLKPLPQIDQNIQAALWLLNLARVSGEPGPGELGEWVMRYLSTPEVALSRITEAGILEADARLLEWRARSAMRKLSTKML
ncbi:MAG: DUF255 domain-containing protein [Gammaproteobacteria bacterium]